MVPRISHMVKYRFPSLIASLIGSEDSELTVAFIASSIRLPRPCSYEVAQIPGLRSVSPEQTARDKWRTCDYAESCDVMNLNRKERLRAVLL